MRKTILGLLGLLSLTACNEGDYGHNGGYGDDHGGYYGHDRDDYGYGSYYPYGHSDYPRDRIWIVDGYHGCRYYPYQGYCYRYKDDYYRAIEWDRAHGYDDNWHQRRKNWCNKHDCSHDRNDHDDRYKDDQNGNVHRGMEDLRGKSQDKPRLDDNHQQRDHDNRRDWTDQQGEYQRNRPGVTRSDDRSDMTRSQNPTTRAPERQDPVVRQHQSPPVWGGTGQIERRVPEEQRIPVERVPSEHRMPVEQRAPIEQRMPVEQRMPDQGRGTVPGKQRSGGVAAPVDTSDDQQQRHSRHGRKGENIDSMEQ